MVLTSSANDIDYQCYLHDIRPLLLLLIIIIMMMMMMIFDRHHITDRIAIGLNL